jgi:hypothetical protein
VAKIANLSADLVANTSSFEADLKRADRALNSSQAQWKRSLTAIDKQFGALGSSVGGVSSSLFDLKGAFSSLIGILGIGSLAAFARQSLDAAGGIGELAAQVGLSTDTLQAFDYAATQVGLSSEEMRAGVAKLTRTIGEAADGSKSAIDAFNSLGVNILDASGKIRSTEDVIRDVADRLAAIDDPAKRAAAAVDLFGKAGQKMLPFLENGAAGVDELVTNAKALGVVLGPEFIAKADAASDAISALELRFSKAGQAAAAAVAGPLLDFLKYLDEADKRAAAAQGKILLKIEIEDQENAIRRLEKERQQQIDAFQNDKDLALNLYSQEQLDADLGRIDAMIAAARSRIQTLRSGGSAEAGQRTGSGTPLVFPTTGANNPPPASSGEKTSAEKQAETLSKKIADLQLQVDTFDLGPVDQQVASALQGINQSLPGAKEGAIAISNLIHQLGALKQAQDEDKASVAEYDKIVADADAAWQKRLADGKALMEAVRTPLEAYQATVETLNTALAVGTINQETYNRSVEAAQDAFRKASEGTDTFRQYSEDAMGTLWSGLIDAAFAADNLQEALRGVLIQLAKMAASKAFSAILDKGLDALFDAFSPSASTIPIGPTYRGHATGGPAGGRVLVGERGPELLDLPAGSFITTAKASAPMLDQRIAGSAIGGPAVSIGRVEMNFEGGAGTPEQNTDLSNKMIEGLRRSLLAAVDERIGDQQRSGGILNPGMGF